MYPSVIEDFARPTTLAEARAILAANPDATLIAGGQSLMQAVKSRLVQPRMLVDLSQVAELRGVGVEPDQIRIGGMTRYRTIHESASLLSGYEALVDAASHVGDRQVRNRGTIGGSLCWNYVAACMPPTSICVGAELELVAADGASRRLAAEDFLKGPLETELQPGEVLTAVILRKTAAPTGSAYSKWGLGTDALPIVGIGALVELDPTGRCRRARIAVGGLAAGPTRAVNAEGSLSGATAADANLHIRAARLASEEVEAHSDHLASAEYRRVLIARIGTEIIGRAFARAAEKTG